MYSYFMLVLALVKLKYFKRNDESAQRLTHQTPEEVSTPLKIPLFNVSTVY